MHPKDKRRRQKKIFWAYVEKGCGVGDASKNTNTGATKSANDRRKPMRPRCYVDIGSKNVKRWIRHKHAYGYDTDSGFTTFLLGLLEQLQPTLSVKKISNTASSLHQVTSEVNSCDAVSVSDCAVDLSGDARYGDSQPNFQVDEEYSEKENPGDLDSDVSWDGSQAEDSDDSMSESVSDVDWTSTSSCPVNSETLGGLASGEKTTKTSTEGSRQPKVKRKTAATRRKYKKKRSGKKCKGSGIAKKRKCIHCNRNHIFGECPFTRPVMVVLDNTIDTPKNTSIDSSIDVAIGMSVDSLIDTPVYSQIGTQVDTQPATIVDCTPDIDDGLRLSAEYTLPNVLKLAIVDEQHGLGVVAFENILQYTQFGPLVGERIKETDISENTDLKNIWEVYGGDVRQYINTFNGNISNWLRYMRPAPLKKKENVAVIIKENDLYFITTKFIEAGTELVYWVEDPTWSFSKKAAMQTYCQTCRRTFSHPLYYLMHCGIFHDPKYGRILRKYHCKICGMALFGRKSLIQHATEMHDGKGAYQCQCCKQHFTGGNCLASHLRYHCKMNPDRNRTLCELCGKDFSKPSKLKVHIRRMHSDDSEMLKEFQCQQCSKLMSSRPSLQRHMKEVHTMNEIATCDRCGKTFQNRSNLKIHMLTHSGVKPFRCTEIDCAAAFTTKQCLQFHYKKVHGYTMDNMPAIERCVAYTFENYADGHPVGEEATEVS